MNKLKNSKIILVLSVLLLFLVIGSASAVDETSNETISTPENNGVDTLSQSVDSVDDGVSATESSDMVANDTSNNKLLGLSNDDVLSADVGSFNDLKSEVTGSGNIKLNYQEYKLSKLPNSGSTSAIVLTKSNVCIDGQGAVIDGQKIVNNYRLFYMKNLNNVTFKNINFKNILVGANLNNYMNVKSGGISGGVFYCDFGCKNILFENCTFTDIITSMSAGAIYIKGDSRDTDDYINPKHTHDGCTNVTVIGCDFIRVHALNSGGAVNFHNNHVRGGGLINCTFINVTSANYGAAFEMYVEYGIVENCTFIGCLAGAQGGAFNLHKHANNVTIKNCEFINNSAGNRPNVDLSYSNSGAIASSNPTCMFTHVENCTFINNTSPNNGGAVFFNGMNSTINNCIFINNNATNGGSVYFSASGSNLTNSSFINNSATEGGAVKFDAQNGYMGFCTYINNTATKDGGALCSEATGSIVEVCEFINNTAPVGKDFYGHKIPITFKGMTFTSLWLTNIDYKDPDLTGSPLVNYGYGTDASTPAIWDENALSFLKKNVHCTIYLVDHINNVDIINNLTQEVLNVSDLEIVGYDPVWNKNSSGVVDLSGWNHRAFTVNASDVKFTNLTFKNANISGNGGALRIINDAAVIENCTFMNNTACNGSAISFEKGVVLIIENSTFINNTALGNGTVYMYDDANSTMTLNSTFMDNTAYLGSAIYYAGPVWYYADGLTLTNLIKANDTNKDLYDDILPYWENNTKIFTGFNESYWYRAKRCVMDVYVNLAGYSGVHNGTRDDPTDVGMAFQMVAPTGTIHFVNSSETWNMTKLYNKNEEINYKFGITFEGNNTTSTDYKFINTVYGYDVTMSDFHIINTDTCIEWKARNGRIINSSFTSKDHVALNITGNDLTICDSSFTGNGNGALYVDASGLKLSNCTFNNNNISSGVGSHIVLTENANNTRIIDSRFIKGNNTGIWVNATGVSISGSNFTDNTGINGGALILSNGTLVLSNNNFTYNKADVGGAIYLENGNLFMSGNNFTHNNVSGNGGALFLSNGNLSMSGNNFTYNKAVGDGGAVYLENGTLKEALVNDFWHNRASNNGGALYTNIPVVMNGGVFFNNTADVCGGGIYLNNTNNTLSNMEFNNNTAVNGSAIYVTKNNTLNVNNIVLKGNTHTDFSNIDSSANYGSIYLSNYLSEGLFKDSNLDLGDLQDIWDGTYRLPVIYVNNTGTNKTGGASPETATSLDNALDHLIDGGKIILTTNYDIDDMVNLTNRTLTLTSNNSSSIIRKDSTGKYLFNPLKKIKNLSLNNYLSSQSLKIKKIKNVQNKYFH